MFVTRMQEMTTAMKEFYSTVVEQIKNMPVFSTLEEKVMTKTFTYFIS